jgi:hypothetical protein
VRLPYVCMIAVKFLAELETKLLIGEVKEKQEARVEYNAAIARGETAALLEQDKRDIFRQKGSPLAWE